MLDVAFTILILSILTASFVKEAVIEVERPQTEKRTVTETGAFSLQSAVAVKIGSSAG